MIKKSRVALLLLAILGRPCLAEIAFPRHEPAYIVAAPQTKLEQRALDRLAGYVGQVLEQPPRIVGKLSDLPDGAAAMVLVNQAVKLQLPVQPSVDSPESFALITMTQAEHALAVMAGSTDHGLKRAVQRLIIESRQEVAALVIPDLNYSETPWIAHREWTLCPWGPQFVRGVFVNPHADKRMEIRLYGPQQLESYVEMFDAFGYSGCQLIETCHNYAVFGSIEANQQWQKALARMVHENGQQVTLWVWAAQFSGFGWNDPQVLDQPVPAKGVFDDPATRRIFERYYDDYTNLSPDIDRLIGHFFDPGTLRDVDDVFQYMRLLEQKTKAKNPNIQMCIDYWAAGQDFQEKLVKAGFKDYLLLASSMPMAAGKREQLHEQAHKLNLPLGIWGWYTTEYETDQLASLYVNAQVLKSVYGQIRQGPFKTHPIDYWSEMEAHHLNNIYSMYAAAQLLWNPDRDPHQILQELATGIWGPHSGLEMLKTIELVQDMRSGPTWETYWWTQSGHRVGSDKPADDLKRVDESLAALANLKPDPNYVSKFPLPFPPDVFVELMVPHLRQIKAYAEFRIQLAAIRQAADNAPPEKLKKMLIDAWHPIPEYNTWVGTFGNQESFAQDKAVRQLMIDLQLTVPDPGWLRLRDADRLLQLMQNRQSAARAALPFKDSASTGEFRWTKARAQDRFQKLVDDGAIEKMGSDTWQLINWSDYARH